ncbi:MAG: NAD(+)/NADH kinase [Polyangiaceae bacterium]
MSNPRVIVVVKRSALRRYVEEEGDGRARRLVRRNDPTVAHWRQSHLDHERTVEAVEAALDSVGARVVVLRGSHAAFDSEGASLVVAVGGDGTLLAASHNVGNVPVLGVNSAPRFSVGFFCAARRSNLRRMLGDALEGTADKVRLARMTVSVNGRVRSKRVLNEALYCHCSPAATSRYLLSHRRIREEHKSSGFWVGPAAGSTAAQRSAGGRILPLRSRKLQLVVREPYPSFGRRYRLARFLVEPGERVVAESMMHEACMFLDGPYRRIGFGLGDSASFTLSEEPLTVLGLSGKRALATA